MKTKMIKNPSGESMPQAPNLLDMFWNRNEVQSKGAKPAESKRSAAVQGSGNSLLPLDSADGKSGIAAPNSFQERVKESRNKLSAKAHRFFPQANEAKHEGGSKEKTAVDRRDRPDRAETPRSENPEMAEAAGRARHRSRENMRMENRASGEAQGDRAESKHGCAPESDGTGETASGSVQEVRTAESSHPGREKAELDEAALAKLKEGLDRLGIVADEAQLNDPAFLADMLLLLQPRSGSNAPEALVLGENGTEAEALTAPAGLAGTTMSPAATLNGDEAAGASPVDMAAQNPEETGLPGIDAKLGNAGLEKSGPAKTEAMAADPKLEDGSAQSAVSDNVFRKEVAALIRDRITELTGDSSTGAQTASTRPANLPAATPAEWQGVEVRPQRESAGLESVPVADLDRLRVMQAAAFQAQATGKETGAAIPTEGADASQENTDGMEDTVLLRNPEATGEGEGDLEEHGFSGGKQNAAGNAEVTLRKEGSHLQKDAAVGQNFHNSLEQVRPAEHRESVQRAWAPHQPAMEKSVLEQISRKMSGLGIKSGEELSIQLAPENLGKVRVSLELRDGVMAARIGVENEGVRQIVEANIAGLRESLENQGIKLQGLEVSVDQRQGSLFNPDGSNAESFFQRRGRTADGSADGSGSPAFETAPESDTGRRLGYNTLEYIG